MRSPASEYIAHLLEEWTRTETMVGVHRELTKYGQVSRSHLINVRDGHKGVGIETERIFAAKLFGGSVDALRHAAEQYVSRGTRAVQSEPQNRPGRSKNFLTRLLPWLHSIV